MTPTVDPQVLFIGLVGLVVVAAVMTGVIVWATRCTLPHCDEHCRARANGPGSVAQPAARVRDHHRGGPRSPFTVRHSPAYLVMPPTQVLPEVDAEVKR